LWYPIKSHLMVDELKQASRDLGLPRTWCVETLMHPRDQSESFNGSGLIVFNAPYLIPERMTAVLPFLARQMSLHATHEEWLTAP